MRWFADIMLFGPRKRRSVAIPCEVSCDPVRDCDHRGDQMFGVCIMMRISRSRYMVTHMITRICLYWTLAITSHSHAHSGALCTLDSALSSSSDIAHAHATQLPLLTALVRPSGCASVNVASAFGWSSHERPQVLHLIGKSNRRDAVAGGECCLVCEVDDTAVRVSNHRPPDSPSIAGGLDNWRWAASHAPLVT